MVEQTAPTRAGNMKDLALGVTWALAAAVSAYLWSVHIDTAAGEAVGGLCDMGERLNCAAAAASDWSTVAGVPVALFGLAWYVAALCGLVAWRATGHGVWGARMLLYGALFGVGYSVVLLVVSLTQLGSVCPGCLALYVLNTAAVVLTWRLPQRSRDGGMLVPALTSAVFVLLVGAGLMLAPSAPVGPQPMSRVSATDWMALVGGDAPRFGAEGAPVNVVEFSDFECPHCARLASTLHDVIAARDDVRLTFRHKPLSFHMNARGASIGAICAGEQGAFWPFHDALFADQTALRADDLAATAEALSLDVDAWRACVASPEAAARLDADLALGAAVGVNATPTFIVNGDVYAGALPAATLEAIFDAARQ